MSLVDQITAAFASVGAAVKADRARLAMLETDVHALPSDYGYKTWTFDPGLASSSVVITGGLLYVTKFYNRNGPTVINSVEMFLGIAGASLTNVGCCVFSAIGAAPTVSSVNANGATAAAFQTAGKQSITFGSTPSMAGPFYVAFWATGTTLPSFIRTGTTNGNNIGLTGANLRYASGNSGLTNTAPATLGSLSGSGSAFFVGIK